jgi:hypothetical protein
VKLTVAPDAGVEAMVTMAAIVTMELVFTGLVGADTVTAKVATLGMIVAVAVPVEESVPFVAIAFTGYVDALALEGILLVIVVADVIPGAMVRELDANAVVHALGSSEEMAKVRGAHIEVSLFATVTV